MDYIKEQIKKKRSYLNKSTRNLIQLETLLVKKNLIPKNTLTIAIKKRNDVEIANKIYEALLTSSQVDPQDFISCLKDSGNSHLLPCFFKPEVDLASKKKQNESADKNTKSVVNLPVFFLLVGSFSHLKVFTSFFPLDTNLLTTVKLKYTKVDCPLLQKCLQECINLKSLLLDNIRVSRKPSSSLRPHLPNIKEYLYKELALTERKSKSSFVKKPKSIWQDYIIFEVTNGEQLTLEVIKSSKMNISIISGEQILLLIDLDHQKLITNYNNGSNIGFHNLLMLFRTLRNISMSNVLFDIRQITHDMVNNISDLTLHNSQVSTLDFHKLMNIPNRIKSLKIASCQQLSFDFADLSASVGTLALHDIQGVCFTQGQPSKKLVLDSLLISNTSIDKNVQDMFSKALKCNRVVLGHLKPQETYMELQKTLVESNFAKIGWLLVWSMKWSTMGKMAHCLVPLLNFSKPIPAIYEKCLSSNQLEEKTISEEEATEIISDMLGANNFYSSED